PVWRNSARNLQQTGLPTRSNVSRYIAATVPFLGCPGMAHSPGSARWYLPSFHHRFVAQNGIEAHLIFFSNVGALFDLHHLNFFQYFETVAARCEQNCIPSAKHATFQVQ